MCCSSPPPPPDLGPMSEASEEVARIQQQTAMEQLDWAREQDGRNQELLQEVLDIQMPAMREQFEQAQSDRERYETLFRPMEDAFQKEAENYDSPERREAERAKALADTSTQFDQQRKNALSRLESYGVDPSQTRNAALDIGTRTAQAAASVAAVAGSDKRVEDTGRALRSDAINLGRGALSNAAGFYGASVGAGGQAQQGAYGATQSGAGAIQSGLGFSGQALQGYGQSADIQSQGFNNQMASWQAGSDQTAGMLGAVGGMAGMFMADGGPARYGDGGPAPPPGGFTGPPGGKHTGPHMGPRTNNKAAPAPIGGRLGGTGSLSSVGPGGSNGMGTNTQMMAMGMPTAAQNTQSRIARGANTTVGQDLKGLVTGPASIATQGAFRGVGAVLKTPAAVADAVGYNPVPGEGGIVGNTINKMDSAGSTMNGLADLGLDNMSAGPMSPGSTPSWSNSVNRAVFNPTGRPSNTRGITGYVPRNMGLERELADGGSIAPAGPLNAPNPQFVGAIDPMAEVDTGTGDGSGIDDSVPAYLSDGEYVIPEDVVRAKGEEFFDKLIERYHTPASEQQQRAA